VGDNVTITGKLVDEQGNPISNMDVTITVNGERFTATTDKNGNYHLEVSNIVPGLNDVRVDFVNDDYKPSSAQTSFVATKHLIIGQWTLFIVNDTPANNSTGGNNSTVDPSKNVPTKKNQYKAPNKAFNTYKIKC